MPTLQAQKLLAPDILDCAIIQKLFGSVSNQNGSMLRNWELYVLKKYGVEFRFPNACLIRDKYGISVRYYDDESGPLGMEFFIGTYRFLVSSAVRMNNRAFRDSGFYHITCMSELRLIDNS